MSKYIIKNCPSFCRDICSADDTDCFCCNETDCVMKQIVELCKENLNSLETYVDVRSLECAVLQNILQLLDIQEIK